MQEDKREHHAVLDDKVARRLAGKITRLYDPRLARSMEALGMKSALYRCLAAANRLWAVASLEQFTSPKMLIGRWRSRQEDLQASLNALTESRRLYADAQPEADHLQNNLFRFVYGELIGISKRWPGTRVAWNGPYLLVPVGDVSLDDKIDEQEQEVYIGRFEIGLSLGPFLENADQLIESFPASLLAVRQVSGTDGQVQLVDGDSMYHSYEEVPASCSCHPHALSSGAVCLGDRTEAMLKLYNSLNLYETLEAAEAAIRNYNDKSAYNFAASWARFSDSDLQVCRRDDCNNITRKQCAQCDRVTCLEHLERCPVCDNLCCPRCASHCGGCDQTVCDGCRNRECYRCDESVCQSCITSCSQCGRDFCGYCTSYCDECGETTCNTCECSCHEEPEEDDDDGDDEDDVDDSGDQEETPAEATPVVPDGLLEGAVCLPPSGP